MSATKDFRLQSTTPASPVGTAGASYYADQSGVLKFVRADGSVYFAGQVYEQTLSGIVGNLATATGVTGYQYVAATPFLGAVGVQMLIVQGPSGKLAIPAYSIS